MAAAKAGSRQERNAQRAATENFRVGRFALLSEMLLVGVCTFALALPLVTAPAAFAAGAAHVGRHVEGKSDTVASLWHDFRAALPGSWKFGFGWLGACLIALLNALLAASAQLPGGRVVLGATVLLVAALGLLLLRSAALWQAGPAGESATPDRALAPWPAAWEQARQETGRDLSGTALLLLAMVMSLVFVWMLPPLVFIAPGVLILAVVSVRYRFLRKFSWD